MSKYDLPDGDDRQRQISIRILVRFLVAVATWLLLGLLIGRWMDGMEGLGHPYRYGLFISACVHFVAIFPFESLVIASIFSEFDRGSNHRRRR